MLDIISPVLVLGVLGGLLGFGLAFAADKLRVEPDKRIQAVHERLPKVDCGACGYPGCEAFAEAVVEGEVESLSQCKPGNKKHYADILEYLKNNPDEDGNIVKVKM